jgi:hypothetical protein
VERKFILTPRILDTTVQSAGTRIIGVERPILYLVPGDLCECDRFDTGIQYCGTLQQGKNSAIIEAGFDGFGIL